MDTPQKEFNYGSFLEDQGVTLKGVDEAGNLRVKNSDGEYKTLPLSAVKETMNQLGVGDRTPRFNTSENPINTSPISNVDQIKMGAGNLAGNIDFLQKKYGEVKQVVDPDEGSISKGIRGLMGDKGPAKELLVKYQNVWHRVNAHNGTDADASELSYENAYKRVRDVVQDVSSLAPTLVQMVAMGASDVLTGNPLAGVVTSGLVKSATISAAKEFGTYKDEDPHSYKQEASDVGWDMLMASGGYIAAPVIVGSVKAAAKIGIGTVKGANKIVGKFFNKVTKAPMIEDALEATGVVARTGGEPSIGGTSGELPIGSSEPSLSAKQIARRPKQQPSMKDPEANMGGGETLYKKTMQTYISLTNGANPRSTAFLLKNGETNMAVQDAYKTAKNARVGALGTGPILDVLAGGLTDAEGNVIVKGATHDLTDMVNIAKEELHTEFGRREDVFLEGAARRGNNFVFNPQTSILNLMKEMENDGLVKMVKQEPRTVRLTAESAKPKPELSMADKYSMDSNILTSGGSIGTPPPFTKAPPPFTKSPPPRPAAVRWEVGDPNSLFLPGDVFPAASKQQAIKLKEFVDVTNNLFRVGATRGRAAGDNLLKYKRGMDNLFDWKFTTNKKAGDFVKKYYMQLREGMVDSIDKASVSSKGTRAVLDNESNLMGQKVGGNTLQDYYAYMNDWYIKGKLPSDRGMHQIYGVKNGAASFRSSLWKGPGQNPSSWQLFDDLERIGGDKIRESVKGYYAKQTASDFITWSPYRNTFSGKLRAAGTGVAAVSGGGPLALANPVIASSIFVSAIPRAQLFASGLPYLTKEVVDNSLPYIKGLKTFMSLLPVTEKMKLISNDQLFSDLLGKMSMGIQGNQELTNHLTDMTTSRINNPFSLGVNQGQQNGGQ